VALDVENREFVEFIGFVSGVVSIMVKCAFGDVLKIEAESSYFT
jgi:hypothetical protein